MENTDPNLPDQVNFLSIDKKATASYLINGKEIECPNLVSEDDRKLWLSSKRQSSFPYVLLFDLTGIKCEPKAHFRSIAFRCWHSYTTNPSLIRVSFSSSDKLNFVPW